MNSTKLNTFVISTCIYNDLHLNQLLRCINSIRFYYETILIILINDSDDTFNINELFKHDTNIIIIDSLLKGSADQQVFKIIINNDSIDTAIIIQDSMILNKPLDNIDKITEIQFLWHFTNHIYDWDKIEEPHTDYNVRHSIITHTDLIKHQLCIDYNDNPEFLNFALNALNNKESWCGCIGNVSIINRNALIYINNKVNFIDKFIKYDTNRLRRVNESIYPLICHYVFPKINFHNSYDGLYYDGITCNYASNTPTGFDNLVWCCKNPYISKISFGR
jgi:hypothetical protein